MKNLIYFIIFIVILLGCKKEQPKLPNTTLTDNCPEQYIERSTPLPDTLHKTDSYPITPGTYMFDYQTKFLLESPVSNPNNPFEFAFLRKLSENISPSYELCIYNFCTNELNVVTDVVSYSLDWGANNWLIFIGAGNQAWKIKPDGSGLTQLTFYGEPITGAKWSPSGNKFVYSYFGSLYIANENGENISQFSLNLSGSFWTWKGNNIILYTNIQGDINTLDITTGNQENIFSSNIEGIGPVSVDNEDNIYFNSSDRLYALPFTGQLTQLDTNYFTFRAYYPQALGNNQLLMLRYVSDTSEYDNNIVLQSQYFSLFNLNTKEERIIDLPE